MHRYAVLMLALLGTAVVGAAASAETVVENNSFPYAVGEPFTYVGCDGTESTAMIVSGVEQQMARTHYDRNGNVVWTSEHQTHAALKIVLANGEVLIVQEVDNWKTDADGHHWVGQEFTQSVGRYGTTYLYRFAFVYSATYVDGTTIDETYHAHGSCVPA